MTERSSEQREAAHRLFRPIRFGRIGTVSRVQRETEKEGGGTFTRSGESVSEGERYVHNPEPTTVHHKGSSFESYRSGLRKLHASNPKAFRTGARYYGTYKDDTGTVHFDQSVASDDREAAVRSAKTAGQHSIWDRKEGKEIVLCKSGSCSHGLM